MVTNMDADAQVPLLYVQEVDRAAAAAEDPHLLVRCRPVLPHQYSCNCRRQCTSPVWAIMAV